MVEFTFFEIHLDDARFESNAPFASTGGDGTDSGDDWGTDSEGTEAGGGPGPGAAVVGLLALVVAVVVARRVLGDSDDAAE